MSEEHWLRMAVDLARANVVAGGGPFGAVIVRGDALIATGQNRVTRDLDPTAHAEVMAIREACSTIGDFSLVGMTLYTSCEPCPLCASAALWARLDRIVFAADRHDAARGGFDDRDFYELMSQPTSTWPMPVTGHRIESAATPFDDWIAQEGRTPY
jgi:guanine deaminase